MTDLFTRAMRSISGVTCWCRHCRPRGMRGSRRREKRLIHKRARRWLKSQKEL